MVSSIVCRTLGAVLLLSALGAGAGAAVLAAQSRTLPDAPGTWKPIKPFFADSQAVKDRKATPALIKAFDVELRTLNAILQKAPGVAVPKGFSVETWGHLASYASLAQAQQPAAGPLSGALTFGAFPIFEYERNGKMIREDTGETALLEFSVNLMDSWLFGGRKVPEWGAESTEAFFEPIAGVAIAGLTRYGDALIIARNPAPLWVPLPLGAALDVVVASRRAVLEGYRESFAAFSARLAVLRDPVREAERMKFVKESAATLPNREAFVAEMAGLAKVEEAQVVREIGPTGGTGKGLADAQRALDEATAWLAELSPAERAAPACYAEAGQELRSKFRTASGVSCRPLVTPNYKFFNPSLSRSAPQVVVITPVARCFDTANKYNLEANSPSPAGCSANRHLVETLDLDAVRAWLR